MYGGDFLHFFLLTFLVLAVIFVNGWTDAPNSITTVVATGTLSFRRAATLAAFCDLIGMVVTSLLCPTVAQTVFSIVDFGNDPHTALMALQAALLSIVIWALLAWRFGIPTSESHALISGLTGAAIALHGNLDGVSAEAWSKVLTGLLLSTLCGAFVGYYAARYITFQSLSSFHVRKGQIFCTASMAFFHGAQDGQKFLALLLLTQALARGQTNQTFSVSLPLTILCASVMAFGVICGGQRIISTVSQSMRGLDQRQGLAADLAGSICLLTASLAGLPVSTTHTKISVLLGAGISSTPSRRSKQIALRILFTWLITFPCCGFLAWGITRLMLL